MFDITDGEDYVPSSSSLGVYSVDWASSTLTLPIVDRNCDDLFKVPMIEYDDQMYYNTVC